MSFSFDRVYTVLPKTNLMYNKIELMEIKTGLFCKKL